MANISGLVDSMLREYLLFRGFTATFKALESEIKSDKDKSFRVDKVVEQIQFLIVGYDLAGLKSYWSHLDRRFFSKLSHDAYKNVCKLETSVLRLYLVHAIQNSKQEKVTEFFERSASELQNLPTWKDWFAIPFLKNPEQNPMFSIYFTRVWQESVMVALYNCISTVFSNLTLPSILNFEKEREKLERIKEENIELRKQIVSLQEELVKLRNEKNAGKKNVSVQTANVSIGEECDYLVVSTKTIHPPKEPTTASKKPRFKLKGSKDSKSKKPQEEIKEGLFKKKKIWSFDKKEEEEVVKPKTENHTPQASPKIVIKNDLNRENSEESSPMKSENQNSNKGASKEPAAVTISSSLNISATKDFTVHDNLLTGSLDHFTDEMRKPFIILSQEEYTGHYSPLVNCRFSGDGRVVGSIDTDGVIKLWQCHPTPITTATIASKAQALSFDWVPKLDGKLLYGSYNGKISLYDLASKKVMMDATVDSKYQRIVSLASSPNGSSFVSSASSGIRKRSETFSIGSAKRHGHGQLTKMQSLTDSNKPSTEGTIFHWDMKTFKEQAELVLDPYPACIHCMSYNHNGTLLVTGGADGMIRLFDMRTCDCLVGWHAHSTDVLDVQFSVDETSLFSLGADGKLCLWDVHKVSFKIAEFTLHSGCTGISQRSIEYASSKTSEPRPGGRLLAFDTDGKYMLTCASSGALMYMVDSKYSLEQVMTIPGQKSAVTTLDWNPSPNCSIFVTGQSNGVIQVSSLLRR